LKIRPAAVDPDIDIDPVDPDIDIDPDGHGNFLRDRVGGCLGCLGRI
jgi:hypothetical protein